MSEFPLLAHSAPSADREPQLYTDHVRDVVCGARENAEAVAACVPDKKRAARLVAAVADAAMFHDLGKLDPDNQAALRQGRQGRMRWDHVDAGVAHLLGAGAKAAAWIVRAHHNPGLPAKAAEFNSLDPNARGLRGGRVGARDPDRADELIARTDRMLPDLLATHAAAASAHDLTRYRAKHGLFMRVALSCLVDGDHADAACYEHGRLRPSVPAPRWEERLAHLDAYVAALPRHAARQENRDIFYRACRDGPVNEPMVTCEGPVGIGKTTAVAAWCIRRAIESRARRIFVVAPYTTILSQTAKTVRSALLLPDEVDHADEIVAEHHHRAEFHTLDSRDLALLWRAPIVVTTGVQFFETLAACAPARLRKLHGLPSSVVFLDEAHAALSGPLWRQNWAWMRELALDWSCSFVFASGSLARVWEEPDIVGEHGVVRLPDIVPPVIATRLNEAEHARVRYTTLGRLSVADAITTIQERSRRSGPCLAVFNTVQTAAAIAHRLRQSGADVLHLSTALSPWDRDRILNEVKRRLDERVCYGRDWTLVATSLVEAGVDLSFRTAVRERFSTASLIQIGGRANRHGDTEPGEVIDLQLDADADMTTHPAAARSAAVLGRFIKEGLFNEEFNPASLVTRALREELRDDHGGIGVSLSDHEAARDYPKVAELGRLIDAETALVVVDIQLKRLLAGRRKVSARRLLAGSVQLWSNKIEALALDTIPGRPGLYNWPHDYDANFLGYMAAVLKFRSGEAFVI